MAVLQPRLPSALLAAIGAYLLLVPPAAVSTAEGDTNRFRDPSMIQDRGHLKEHVQELTEEQISQMSPEELEWHFFKSHDSDKNLKLDGLEIMAAMEHRSEYSYPPDPNERIEYYTGLVDQILEEDDTDNDGMMSYIEYVMSTRKYREANAKANRENQ
ncbi:PREDICTED: multiple coagulation factor deficiency protein 2 homolog [Branchiostoma belcheri]|uniref:Multiple coagulation factor deficiency protein 2 homolog n=1 Tax=Branchiostoma belcheri TaxID=7741 RepID=A0A6P4XNM1_BRABE|nr:PREDICTED: multiple coagulation factor deficiency protein 2 homolog [Branchiostoma belcheri]